MAVNTQVMDDEQSSTCMHVRLEYAAVVLAVLHSCRHGMSGTDTPVNGLQVLQHIVCCVNEKTSDHGVKCARCFWPGVYLLHIKQ